MEDLDSWLAENVMGWVGENKRSNSFLLIWHPTTDISQAFQAVEKTRTLHPTWYMDITAFPLNYHDTGWVSTWYESAEGHIIHACEDADTPAMAICLAAKAAVGD